MLDAVGFLTIFGGARQPAWSVNALALALVAPLLARTDLPAWANGIARLRARLARLFTAAGFTTIESAANWVLVQNATPLRERLAQRGVLVRDCANFGLDGTIRVAVPSADDLERLASALRGALSDATP